MTSDAVVYLTRKVDGYRYLAQFLASLKRFPAEHPYHLVVILKGYAHDEVPAVLRNFAAPYLSQVNFYYFDDAKFATEAFRSVAQDLTYEKLIFFVSSTRVLSAGWARILFHTLEDPKIGLVGTSSGLESLDAQTPFPNSSIRTTGFAVRRREFSSLDFGDLSQRYGGNLFEAGSNSMTKQFKRLGRHVVLVDRHGQLFSEGDWPQSRTFRLGQQEGLMFADGRTDQFDLARPKVRRHLSRINWGPDIPIIENSFLTVYVRRSRRRLVDLFWSKLGRYFL